MPHPNRISLSLAGTAAVALASLPLGITPASAARVSEGTASSIGVVEDASNSQQFNLGNLGVQGASTVLVAQRTIITSGGGGRVRAFLNNLLEYFGIQTIGDCRERSCQVTING